MLIEPKPAGSDRFRFARPGSSGVEQLTRNEQVAGSIPASGSNISTLHGPQTDRQTDLHPSNLCHRRGVKLVVPAYFGPWERHHWAMLFDARPSVVVINPASGPGREPGPGYGPLVEQFQRYGTTVLGYVTTSWLTRSIPECSADAVAYVDSYGADGVLYDEIPAEPSAQEQLVNLAAVSPHTFVFNPGRQIPSEFRRAIPAATWVSFEGTARQYIERHARAQPAHPKDWHLVHTVPPSLRPRVHRILDRNRPGHAYVTADRMPNPWDVFDPSGLASTCGEEHGRP